MVGYDAGAVGLVGQGHSVGAAGMFGENAAALFVVRKGREAFAVFVGDPGQGIGEPGIFVGIEPLRVVRQGLRRGVRIEDRTEASERVILVGLNVAGRVDHSAQPILGVVPEQQLPARETLGHAVKPPKSVVGQILAQPFSADDRGQSALGIVVFRSIVLAPHIAPARDRTGLAERGKGIGDIGVGPPFAADLGKAIGAAVGTHHVGLVRGQYQLAIIAVAPARAQGPMFLRVGAVVIALEFQRQPAGSGIVGFRLVFVADRAVDGIGAVAGLRLSRILLRWRRGRRVVDHHAVRGAAAVHAAVDFEQVGPGLERHRGGAGS